MIFSLKYTEQMPNDKIGGYAKAWFIRIRPRYKDDKGIHAHELKHVEYWWKYGVIGRLLYKFSKRWRLKEEVECYREQLKYEPATSNPGYYRDMYAGFIADDYGLDVSKGEALERLK